MSRALSNLALGMLAFFGAAGVVAACGSAPARAECALSVVALLPHNPDDVDVGVVRELVRRLNECRAQGDAGP